LPHYLPFPNRQPLLLLQEVTEMMPTLTTHPEVNQLTQELIRYTGETAAEAMLNALRERLERERRKHLPAPRLAEQLMRLGRECAALPQLDTRSAEEILGYDTHGVPA
jgi:antitoxin VapB